MTVQELIKKLEAVDKSKEVKVWLTDTYDDSFPITNTGRADDDVFELYI